MTVLTYGLPLLWLIVSAGAFVFVFRPRPKWPVVATSGRALAVFVAAFLGGGALVAVTRPDASPPPKPRPVPVVRARLPDPGLVRAHPERYLRLDRVKADRGEAVGGRRGDVLLTGGVINTSGLAISDVKLSCRLSSGETPAATVFVALADAVPAGGKLIFAAIRAGQVDKPWDRWTCSVEAAKAAG